MHDPETQAAAQPGPGPGGTLDQAVDSLAGAICHERFAASDLAALRRLQPQTPNAPAYWRLLTARVPPGLRRDEAQETNWAALMQAMAIMAPHAHAPSRPLGRVLAELDQGSLERRLLGLLAARGEALGDQLRLLARFLASKAQPINCRQVAAWLLAPDEPAREKVRRQMARDFYQETYRQEKTAAKDQTTEEGGE